MGSRTGFGGFAGGSQGATGTRCACLLVALALLPAPAVAQGLAYGPQESAPASSNVAAGQISGSVIDANGDLLREAQVVLTRETGAPVEAVTDESGQFHFKDVAAGDFMLTATAPHRTGTSYAGTLKVGESIDVPAMRLQPSEQVNVQVTASREELAREEVRAEEHQRLGGFLPNFFVSYDFNAPPLTRREKFGLAFHNAIDPANFLVNGAIAGVQQATNTLPGYGQGAAGYGKRLGADQADLVSGTLLGGAILPVLFHQDPRYFWKGSGTVKSRALYAVSTAVRARGDNGKWQPAYASILGDLGAGALTNLYYPSDDRNGVGLTFANGLLNVGFDAMSNLVQEFLLRHLTAHAPWYSAMEKD